MHRSFLVFAMAFVALMAGALFYAARIPVETQAPEPAVVGTEEDADAPVFPSFKLVDIDGVERDFSEWQGKHRLLNFWATWCAPCRREIPLLKTFQDEKGLGLMLKCPQQHPQPRQGLPRQPHFCA